MLFQKKYLWFLHNKIYSWNHVYILHHAFHFINFVEQSFNILLFAIFFVIFHSSSEAFEYFSVPSYLISCHNCGHGTDLRGCPQSPLIPEGILTAFSFFYVGNSLWGFILQAIHAVEIWYTSIEALSFQGKVHLTPKTIYSILYFCCSWKEKHFLFLIHSFTKRSTPKIIKKYKSKPLITSIKTKFSDNDF